MNVCMGVYVHLAVAVDRVSDAAWHAIYERARRVAKQWTPRPLSLAWRRVGEEKVVQLVLEVETTEGLRLVGDAETLTSGETFVFPAKLTPPIVGRDREGSPDSSDGDVLVAVGRPDVPDDAHLVHWRNLFGDKTQGFPYHTLIVALGMLVENALPGTAIVYGDVSARNAEEAQRGLVSILGEKLELPVVVDAARLRRRLAAALEGDVLDQAVLTLSPLDRYAEAMLGDLLGLVHELPDMRVHYELEHVVLSCRDPNLLSTETRLVLHTLVEGTRSNAARWEIRERMEQGGRARALAALAHRIMKHNILLTSRAWDAIEAADLNELAFLYAAVCGKSMAWVVHQAVRALLENRALRQV
jgi:hypothetical protein